MKSGNLLLIEDDESTCLLLKQMLKGLGYAEERIFCSNCLGDVAVYRAQQPDLIITDLSLPDSDPTKTFGTVNAMFPEVPILVMTGLDEEDIAINTIAQGAEDYLVKGVTEGKMLRKAIEYALSRKEIKNQLEQSRQDYMRLFMLSPAPKYIFDCASLAFLEVNEAALRQYGYTREEFLKLSLRDIKPDGGIDFLAALSCLPDDFYDGGTWLHRRNGGEEFYVRVYAHAIQFLRRPAMTVMAIDMDRAVKAEQQLRDLNEVIQRQVEQMQAIQDSITDGFFAVDDRGILIYQNRTFEELTGRPRATLAGCNYRECFPVEIRVNFEQAFEQVMRTNAGTHFETYWQKRGIWLSVNVYPAVTGLTVYFEDVTALKQYLEQIEQSNKKLRDIAWIQSHKVRAPLATVLGLVELLAEDSGLSAAQQDIVGKLKEAATDLDKVIHEVVSKTRKAGDVTDERLGG